MGAIVPDAVEQYLAGLNRGGDAVLDDITRQNLERGLPLVDAEVGALLRVLSTAGALPPGGMLLTLEIDAERAQEARENFVRAGLSDRVSVIVGDARLKLAKVAGPFDLIFQDGDKAFYTPALDRLVTLLRPGGLLVTDNVLWDGEVIPGFVATPRQNAEDTVAIAEYNERVASHPQLRTSIVPLRDGVSLSVKL
jgi:predicted O-methyltransferase YrrM